jgi:hypothetical protein
MMSRLLHLINRLKAQASWTMLTASQQRAFDELEKRWIFPDRLNLCGSPGSGKTFLGWVLSRQYQAHFYSSPKTLYRDQPSYPLNIIVDNAPSEEKKLRHLLSELQLRQVRRVLFITQKPIRLGLPIIELSTPTPADITTVYENCGKIQFYSSDPLANKSDKETVNFWNIIYSVL